MTIQKNIDIPDLEKMALNIEIERLRTALANIQYAIHCCYLNEISQEHVIQNILETTRNVLYDDDQ